MGKRLALVDDQPGVTRDLREGAARLGDMRFTVIDTAGLEDATDDSLQGRMRRLTERAVEMADASLFLIDARAGITPNRPAFRRDPAPLGPARDPRREQGRRAGRARPACSRRSPSAWASPSRSRPNMARAWVNWPWRWRPWSRPRKRPSPSSKRPRRMSMSARMTWVNFAR